MTLAEALAVDLCVGPIGYKDKAQTAALIEARQIIARHAGEAVTVYWHSTAQGSAGHSGATESTGSASADAAVRPTNSETI